MAELTAALKNVKSGDVVSLRTYMVPRDNTPGASRVIRIRVP